jgi:hypothetical protein
MGSQLVVGWTVHRLPSRTLEPCLACLLARCLFPQPSSTVELVQLPVQLLLVITASSQFLSCFTSLARFLINHNRFLASHRTLFVNTTPFISASQASRRQPRTPAKHQLCLGSELGDRSSRRQDEIRRLGARLGNSLWPGHCEADSHDARAAEQESIAADRHCVWKW